MLTGDKFMPELHLTQPEFTYRTCGAFTKHERIQKFKETSDLNYIYHIYKKEFKKACFYHNAAYADSNDFTKIIASDKVLKDKAYKNGLDL